MQSNFHPIHLFCIVVWVDKEEERRERELRKKIKQREKEREFVEGESEVIDILEKHKVKKIVLNDSAMKWFFLKECGLVF